MTKCVWARHGFPVSSPIRSQFSLVGKLSRMSFMTIVFLWEHLSTGREGNSDKSSLCIGYSSVGASLVALLVKKPTAMQETLILFLSREDL